MPKITVVGRPGQVEQRDIYVVVALHESAPAGLPTPPANRGLTWAVFIPNRQWNLVQASLRAHPDAYLVIEGYPVRDPNQDRGIMLATCCQCA